MTIRKSKKNRQHSGQMKRNNGTHNDLQNTTQKTKHRTTWTPLKLIFAKFLIIVVYLVLRNYHEEWHLINNNIQTWSLVSIWPGPGATKLKYSENKNILRMKILLNSVENKSSFLRHKTFFSNLRTFSVE